MTSRELIQVQDDIVHYSHSINVVFRIFLKISENLIT